MRNLLVPIVVLVPLLPVWAQEEGQSQKPSEVGPSLEALAEALGSESFDSRSKATEELRGRGEAARATLEAAAKSDNLERRTRAAMLLRELDEAKAGTTGKEQRRENRLRPLRESEEDPAGETLPREPRPEDFTSMPLYFQALERYLEQQREALMRGARGVQILPGISGRSFVLELGPPGMGTVSTSIIRNGEALEMSRAADGKIRFKVEKVDPQTGARSDSRTYEAENLEAFRREYPEICEKYEDTGLLEDHGPGLQVFPDPRFGIGRAFPSPLIPQPMNELGRTGPRLGITAAMVPPALRAHVDLPERALLVESVVGGTPADRMGMREFDILTHVNGQEVGSTEDIRRILTAAPNGEVSSVRVIRKGQALDLTAPKPR